MLSIIGMKKALAAMGFEVISDNEDPLGGRLIKFNRTAQEAS